MEARVRPDKPDKFLFWAVFSTVAGFLVLFYLGHLHGNIGFFAEMATVFLCIIIFIICLWLVLISIIQRRWKTAISTLPIPFLPYLLMFFFHDYIIFACDYIHLVSNRPAYERQIAKLAAPPGMRFVGFDWDFGMVGDEDIRMLIYDETDRIALPPNNDHASPDRNSEAESPPAEPAAMSPDAPRWEPRIFMQEEMWILNRESGPGKSCTGQVRHIDGHFYVC